MNENRDLPSWYARATAWLSSLFRRGSRGPEQIETKGEIETVGADWDAAHGSGPSYQHVRALSAFAAFPATFASVERRAEDLSGIPVCVSLDRDGKERVESHPFLDLLDQPNSAQSGVEFFRQVYADFELTRNAYLFVMRDSRGVPASLLRLHPERIEPMPGRLGLPVGYRNLDTQEEYSVDDVLHIRGISWEDDTRSLHGTSPILALDSTLTAEKEVRDFTGRAAKIGRPSVVLSPHYEGTIWTPEQARQIADEYADKVSNGGALVNRFRAEVDFVQTTPADLETAKTRVANREDIGMVLATPPVVMGVPGSNYAESEQQQLGYWLTHVARGELFSAALTKIARQMDAGRRVFVVYDFSGVPALQRTRNSQLERIEKLVNLGAGPKAAAEFEGLGDAPLPDEKPAAPAFGAPAAPTSDPNDRPEPAQVDEPPGDNDLGPPGDGNGNPTAPKRRSADNVLSFDEWFTRGDVTRDLAYATEEQRSAAWSEWIRSLQEPYQARLNARLRVFFAQQLARVLSVVDAQEQQLAAVGCGVVTRAISVDLIFDVEGEVRALLEAIEQILQDAADAGFSREQVLLGAPNLAFDTREQTVARLASDVSSKITTTTAKRVKAHVDEHLQTGSTIQDLRKALEDDAGFKPERALTIARTESAHAVNVGQSAAQSKASAAGIEFEKVWLSSRDKSVRDAHRELDGVAVDPNENFTSPETGAEAPGPSQFGVGSDDINCRCTTVSRRVRK